MVKRKTKRTYKKKAKAKTRVDKRQDKAIKMLIEQAMPENKFFDFYGVPNLFTGNTNEYSREFTSLIPVWAPNTTVVPTDETNWERMQMREGRKIYMKGISIKGFVHLPPVPPPTFGQYTAYARVRFIMLHIPMVQQPDNTTPVNIPTLRRLLSDPSDLDSLYLKPKQMNYNVLFDKKIDLVNLLSNPEIVLTTTTVPSTTPPYTTSSSALIPSYQHGDAKISFKRNLDMYIKVNKTITYDGSADDGDTARAIKNQYWVFAMSTVPEATSPAPQLDNPIWVYNGRIHFTDGGA